jgi:hypothetical protein
MRGKLVTTSVESLAGGGEVDTDERGLGTSRKDPDTLQGIDCCIVFISREVLSECR